MFLVVCLVAALVVVVVLCVVLMGWFVLRRVDQADIPVALLGLAHLTSALSGLVPWAKPTSPPALPQRCGHEPEVVPPAPAPVVVLVYRESVGNSLTSGAGQP